MKKYICILLLAIFALSMPTSAIVSTMNINACVDYGCGTHASKVYITPIVTYGPTYEPVRVVNNRVSFQIIGLENGTPIKFIATSPSWKVSKNCTIYYGGRVLTSLPYASMKTVHISIKIYR